MQAPQGLVGAGPAPHQSRVTPEPPLLTSALKSVWRLRSSVSRTSAEKTMFLAYQRPPDHDFEEFPVALTTALAASWDASQACRETQHERSKVATWATIQ
jgi:hypothetical protein